MTTGIRAYAFADEFFDHDGWYWGPVSGFLVMRGEIDGRKVQRTYRKDSFTLAGFALPLWVPDLFKADARELALWFLGHGLKPDVALAMVPDATAHR